MPLELLEASGSSKTPGLKSEIATILALRLKNLKASCAGPLVAAREGKNYFALG